MHYSFHLTGYTWEYTNLMRQASILSALAANDPVDANVAQGSVKREDYLVQLSHTVPVY